MATLTITTTAAQDARIIAAFGTRLGLGRNATAAEVKATVIQFLREAVLEQEQAAAIAAAAAGGVPVGGRYRNGSILQIRVT